MTPLIMEKIDNTHGQCKTQMGTEINQSNPSRSSSLRSSGLSHTIFQVTMDSCNSHRLD